MPRWADAVREPSVMFFGGPVGLDSVIGLTGSGSVDLSSEPDPTLAARSLAPPLRRFGRLGRRAARRRDRRRVVVGIRVGGRRRAHHRPVRTVGRGPAPPGRSHRLVRARHRESDVELKLGRSCGPARFGFAIWVSPVVLLRLAAAQRFGVGVGGSVGEAGGVVSTFPRFEERFGGRCRNRDGQVRPAGLRLRRHRHRAQPPHPRPRGRRHLLGDRRLPLRPAAHGGRPWTAVISPATAIEIGRLGGVGVLNLEGLWTRYEDPQPLLDEIADPRRRRGARHPAPDDCGPRSSPSWSASASARSGTPASCPLRVGHAAAHRATFADGSSTPSSTCCVIQGTVVSAEHVIGDDVEPLNLKTLRARARHAGDRRRVRQLPGGAAPHAHRRGRRAGRWRGPGRRAAPPAACSASACPRPPPSPTPAPPACATSTRPASTCRSSPTAACAPAATSPRRSSAAPTRCMIGSPLAAASEAPARGYHWGMATFHPTLPRGARVDHRPGGTLEEILVGPPTRTTAARTCSAPCAPRWPRLGYGR